MHATRRVTKHKKAKGSTQINIEFLVLETGMCRLQMLWSVRWREKEKKKGARACGVEVDAE